jgi:hypothetical protein
MLDFTDNNYLKTNLKKHKIDIRLINKKKIIQHKYYFICYKY